MSTDFMDLINAAGGHGYLLLRRRILERQIDNGVWDDDLDALRQQKEQLAKIDADIMEFELNQDATIDAYLATQGD